jgi:hypothetical protein
MAAQRGRALASQVLDAFERVVKEMAHTKPTGMTMGKAADDKRIKLKATFYNRLPAVRADDLHVASIRQLAAAASASMTRP